MSVITRASASKDKIEDSPSVAKKNVDTNVNNDSHTLDESYKFDEINMEGLTSEEKLNFIHKHVAELTTYTRERAKNIALLKAENKAQDRKIQTLEHKIEALEKNASSADKDTKSLEHKIESLEQYTRRDDVIISGFKPKASSYSRIVKESVSDEKNETAPTKDQNDLEDQLVDFMNEIGIPLKKSDISACHTLGSRDKSRPQPIVVRLVSRKTKTMMMMNAKKLKGNQSQGKVYINEHLSKKNSGIARAARKLKKNDNILSTWTRNCCVFVKVQDGANEKVVKIQDMAYLELFG